jgi:hypothetical protein
MESDGCLLLVLVVMDTVVVVYLAVARVCVINEDPK